PLGVPVDAYFHTGDAKWSDFFREILYDWIDANPKPTVMSGADYPTWRTLDSAARLAWIVSRFDKVTAGKDIEDELWANYLYSIWEHADYLKNDDFSGGNWLATITASVMNVAQEFGEFADRKKWLAFGKTGFERNVLRDIYPDGKEMEDAPGYICMAYRGMFSTLQALEAEGVPVNEIVRRRMDKALDFIGAVTQPNGLMPAIGDWGGGEPWGIAEAIDYFDRDDLRYILSKGAEGTPPPAASINFPQGQWSIMRSPYEGKPWENARHLVFKSSSGSHGHRDVLNITAYAFGRELLIDPGIRSYEHADIQRYRQTAYHNTVCIDGQNQPRTRGKTEKWISNPAFDYVSGTFSGYRGLAHRRSILFVKPHYWLVSDRIIGSGSHTYDQNWHFPPDARLAVQTDSKTIRTNYPEGGNLVIVPADADNLDVEAFDFLIATKRMTASDGTAEAKGARYRRGTPAITINAVLYPYEGKRPPEIAVKQSEAKKGSSATCLQIRIGNRTDHICIPQDDSEQVSHVEDAPWQCNIIDDTSRGADGAKLADVNRDGFMDIVTGWEEGGITRVYLHPGPEKAKQKWPFVTTGKTPSAEDAVFIDLDADGAVDVVSSCEGSTQSIFLQWAPKERSDYLDESKWQLQTIPASKGLTRWMFCIPMQVDNTRGLDLIAGSKEPNAQIGWFETPENARRPDAYKWHTISPAGWIMSLRAEDMDADGDLDILTSDRKGEMRGCRWLENPGSGPKQKEPWKNHFIGCRDKEVMFLTVTDIDGDGLSDVIVAAKSAKQSQIIILRRLDATGHNFKQHIIPYPENTGTAKAVVVGDIDRDGTNDI
ncbi:MAG: heparinase II/III domain-containing protein, partial [Planctomycetota bacterium]